MNYRHAFHAGNFADVHKHVALVSVLLHLHRKEKPFAVIDTHAGAGLYDLSAPEAAKTAEAAGGIAKLRNLSARTAALQLYLETLNAFGVARYPGSPLIAAKLLRPQDRLIAMEKHPQEFALLEESLAAVRNATAVVGDGYRQLEALLPPPERRGVILIDPPYEATDEMQQLAHALGHALRRFANGIFLVWHPLKLASGVQSLVGELQSGGPMKLLSLTFDVGAEDRRAADRLHAAGLLVVNPPFGFDTEMEAVSAELLPLLRRGPDAYATAKWLSAAR